MQYKKGLKKTTCSLVPEDFKLSAVTPQTNGIQNTRQLVIAIPEIEPLCKGEINLSNKSTFLFILLAQLMG